jgi:phage gpG-like protein
MMQANETGMEELTLKLQYLASHCPKIVKKSLEAAAELVIARSRSSYLSGGGGSTTILNVRSGRLWKSIHKRVSVSGNEVKAEIGSNVVYARIHELGGTILPRNGQFLRFMGRGGEYVFMRSVKIPPRPYLSTALRDERPKLPRIILHDIITQVKEWKNLG